RGVLAPVHGARGRAEALARRCVGRGNPLAFPHALAVPTVAPGRPDDVAPAARQHRLRPLRRPPDRRAAGARPARQTPAPERGRTRAAPDPAAAGEPGRGRAVPARAPRLADPPAGAARG